MSYIYDKFVLRYKLSMKKKLTILFTLFCFCFVQAQSISGIVSNIFGEPLIGATIVWQNTSKGVVSDKNGLFEIEDIISNNRFLEISFLGFKSEIIEVKKITYWKIQLIEDNKLSTVEISAKSKATRFIDGVIKTEVLGIRELERAACCSLAGCFNTNASVDAATTNVITDAKE